MIYQRFTKHASCNPNKLALVADGQQWTYSELNDQVQQCASQLTQQGLQPGDCVALMVPNGANFIIGSLAILANGHVLLPLNTGFQIEEVAQYFDSAKAKGIIASVAVIDKHQPTLGSMSSLIAPADQQWGSDTTATTAEPIEADATAVYMFSSGSTGTPKRISRSHAQLDAECDATKATLGLSSDDTIHCSVPLYHAHGFGNCLLAALTNGGTLVIQPGEFNPRKAIKLIEEHRATIYPSVPFMLKMISSVRFKQAPDLSALRLIFTAGAPLDQDCYLQFKQKFGLPIRQLYGSTETGAVAINMDGDDTTSGTVGKPLQGITIDLLDDQGQLVAVGDDGEVAIRSSSMTQQYDNLPELTASSFIDDYFVTGDLGRYDEQGYLTIVGRKKLMINVSGYKVDPADVEACIAQLDAVREVVVVGKPDSNYGEMIKAVIVKASDLDEETIAEHCRQQLAEYKVPKMVEFRTEIPKSPLGKILRKYL